MAKPTLEERVAKLEQQMADLRTNGMQPKKDWRAAIKLLEGDEITQEVFREAMRLREIDRRKARRAFRKRRVKA